MKQLVFIADIDIKASPRVRETICDDTVEDYAANYTKKEAMPLPQLFRGKDEKFFLIADGRHRIEALRSIGRKAIECDVTIGGYQDALRVALQANRAHGLRRSNQDKRRCVEAALREWMKSTDNQIAAMCGVDHKTVSLIRREMEGKKTLPATPIRQGADGRVIKPKAPRKPAVGNSQQDPISPLKEPETNIDETGYPIPPNLMPLWERRGEVSGVLGAISHVKCFLEDMAKKDDPLWREPFLNKAIADLESVYGNLTTAKPFAVCAICQGHPEVQPNGVCRGCKGRGFMSKFRWERVPENIKKVRGTK